MRGLEHDASTSNFPQNLMRNRCAAKVYNLHILAGTFGSYLRISSARDIGLVPPLEEGRIRAVGNAALVGAKMCLLSLEARAEAEDLARRIEHVELPGRKDFQDFYMKSLFFPPL